MRYAYRRFNDYEDFVAFLNDKMFGTGWGLNRWQDVGGDHGIDIRVVFSQIKRYSDKPLPEAK